MESTLSRLFEASPSPELTEADSEDDKPPAASLELVPNFDLDRVPLHLREIFVYAQAWGSLSDSDRHERIERLTDGELHQIVDAVAPYLDDIRAWEASGERCMELDSYLALARAHQEIEAALAV